MGHLWDIWDIYRTLKPTQSVSPTPSALG